VSKMARQADATIYATLYDATLYDATLWLDWPTRQYIRQSFLIQLSCSFLSRTLRSADAITYPGPGHVIAPRHQSPQALVARRPGTGPVQSGMDGLPGDPGRTPEGPWTSSPGRPGTGPAPAGSPAAPASTPASGTPAICRLRPTRGWQAYLPNIAAQRAVCRARLLVCQHTLVGKYACTCG
jgi:hypothetical protein